MYSLDSPSIPQRSVLSILLEQKAAPPYQHKGVRRGYARLPCLFLNISNELWNMRFGAGSAKNAEQALLGSLPGLGIDVERVCVEDDV